MKNNLIHYNADMLDFYASSAPPVPDWFKHTGAPDMQQDHLNRISQWAFTYASHMIKAKEEFLGLNRKTPKPDGMDSFTPLSTLDGADNSLLKYDGDGTKENPITYIAGKVTIYKDLFYIFWGDDLINTMKGYEVDVKEAPIDRSRKYLVETKGNQWLATLILKVNETHS